MLAVAARSGFCGISLTALLVLAGCSTNSNAIYETLRTAMAGEAETTAPKLRPDLQYLRMRLGERTLYLVLGFLERHGTDQTQTWYTGGSEVLKLQNGRIAGSAGMPTDWRMVRRSPTPGWRDIPASGVSYQRERDVMPGYHMGIRELVQIRPIAPVLDSLLSGVSPAALAWFEETIVSSSESSASSPYPKLPAALFAVDLSQSDTPVVFSRQCLSTDMCFSLQPWPPRSAAK